MVGFIFGDIDEAVGIDKVDIRCDSFFGYRYKVCELAITVQQGC